VRRRRSAEDVGENPFGLSIGDLMAALLLIFILLLSTALLRVQESTKDAKRLEEKYVAYETTREELYRALKKLNEELKEDKNLRDEGITWAATLDRHLVFRLKKADALFENGKSVLTANFEKMLGAFFPEYIRILSGQDFEGWIEEVRIEGHTSTRWSGRPYDKWRDQPAERKPYLNNMTLSQNRAVNVLAYVMQLLDEPAGQWTQTKVTANGLSSSRTLPAGGQTENEELSRRVEFRVLLDLSGALEVEDVPDGVSDSDASVNEGEEGGTHP
jgi:outer membrane protein OmpA-like peptidoglycan-associated protein